MVLPVTVWVSNQAISQSESGADQLRQFVRNSKTAEGDFVQQQLRAPKTNEPQDKGLKVVRQTQGRFVFQRPGRFIWDTQKPYEQKWYGCRSCCSPEMKSGSARSL